MDYSSTSCFVGFSSKRRKFQQEKREKEQLQQPMLQQSSVCCDKRSMQMAKEICHVNIFSVATQRTDYRRRAMLRQKTTCRDRT